MEVTATGSGTSTENFLIDADAGLIGLYVSANSGTLTVQIYGVLGDATVLLHTFPALTGTTSEYLTKRLDTTFTEHKVVATYTAAATFKVWAKGTAMDGPATTFDNPTYVEMAGASTSTYSDVRVSNPTPSIQAFLNAHYDPRQWVKYEVLSGTVANAATGETTLTTSTTSYSYAALLTRSKGSYRPGQPVSFRGSAAFSAGSAESLQYWGPMHAESGFAFGRSGTSFGIAHRYGRRLAIYALTLTVGAGGAETATVTLNGTATPVSLTAGTTTHNARELAAATYTGWSAFAVGAVVYFTRSTHGVTAGSFAYASDGVSAGSFAQKQAGANGTETWTAQADFNVDPLDGTGPSGMILDPTKLNIYEIRFGWLGAANIEYYVYGDQRPNLVHRVLRLNRQSAPSVEDPRYPVLYAASTEAGSTSVSVSGASCYAEVRGPFDYKHGPSWSVDVEKTGIGTTEIPLLTLQCSNINIVTGGFNRRRLLLDELHISNTSTKELTLGVYRIAATALTGYNFQWNSTTNGSPLLYSTASTAVTLTNAVSVRKLSVNAGDTVQEPLEGLDLVPGEILCVTGKTRSATTDAVVVFHGYEDF